MFPVNLAVWILPKSIKLANSYVPLDTTLSLIVPPSKFLAVISSKLSVVLSSNCSMVSRIKVLSTATVLFLTPVKFGCSVAIPAFWKSPIDIILVVMIA